MEYRLGLYVCISMCNLFNSKKYYLILPSARIGKGRMHCSIVMEWTDLSFEGSLKQCMYKACIKSVVLIQSHSRLCLFDLFVDCLYVSTSPTDRAQ